MDSRTRLQVLLAMEQSFQKILINNLSDLKNIQNEIQGLRESSIIISSEPSPSENNKNSISSFSMKSEKSSRRKRRESSISSKSYLNMSMIVKSEKLSMSSVSHSSSYQSEKCNSSPISPTKSKISMKEIDNFRQSNSWSDSEGEFSSG